MTVHPTSERLQLYTEQRVGEWERQAIADHLLICERCSGQVLSLQELMHDLGCMRELSLPADFAAQIAEQASQRALPGRARPPLGAAPGGHLPAHPAQLLWFAVGGGPAG